MFKEVKSSSRKGARKEISRGLRLPNFIDLNVNVEDALARFSLAIIGLGSIGCNVAYKVVRMQIGRLYHIDFGHFKPESLLTHPITSEEAMEGKSKAEHAAQYCKELSPSTRCFYYCGSVQDLDISSLADVDLVVMCTDNLAAEVEVTKRCIHLRKPLLQCAVHGDTLIAQVRFLDHNGFNSPCICCSYSETEKELLNYNTVFSCSGAVRGRNTVQGSAIPTMSTAFLCSLAADLGLTMVTRYVLKLGEPMSDSLVEYCGYTNRMVVTPLHKSDSCIRDHSPWEVKKLSHPLMKSTLRDLLLAAELGSNVNIEEISFTVSSMHFAELGICGCSTFQPVNRFLITSERAGRCRKCGKDLYPHPFFSHRPVPGSAVRDILDKPLHRIGARGAESVLVRRNDKGVLFLEYSDR